MKQTDDLTGTYVLVHPELTFDPAFKQNQVGLVTGADLANDDVFVSFGKDGQARYSTDALLTLKPANDLYADVMAGYKEMGTTDYKTLLQITLLQQHGSLKDARAAIELAKDNPFVRDFSMETLENQLGLEQAQEIGR